MTFKIQTIISDYLNANTYLITNDPNTTTNYLIDIGNAGTVLTRLQENQTIKGIFLTHAHLDHISGINEIVEKFPECTIFCSEYTKEALLDSKMNMSFYHKLPITYQGQNIKVISDNEKIVLFDHLQLSVIATPGHNAGSLSFKINQAFFTGDSLIPEIAVVTKLKSGSREEAKQSIVKIRNNSRTNDIIYPGHGKPVSATAIDWDFYV